VQNRLLFFPFIYHLQAQQSRPTALCNRTASKNRHAATYMVVVMLFYMRWFAWGIVLFSSVPGRAGVIFGLRHSQCRTWKSPRVYPNPHKLSRSRSPRECRPPAGGSTIITFVPLFCPAALRRRMGRSGQSLRVPAKYLLAGRFWPITAHGTPFVVPEVRYNRQGRYLSGRFRSILIYRTKFSKL